MPNSEFSGFAVTPTRFLLSVALPGVVALAPWLLVIVESWPAALKLYSDYPVLTNGVLLSSVIITGSGIEGMGSYIEATWDRMLEEKYEVRDNWFSYLAQRAGDERIGHRYIARLVTALKFELGMFLSAPIFLIGVTSLNFMSDFGFSAFNAATLLLTIFATVLFFKEARDSHRGLCETRRELVSRCDKRETV